LDINSLHKLYAVNPFLLSPDSLTIFQQTDYYAGVEWLSAKGLQLKFNGGYTVFNDLPLFLNAEGSGKEMKVLNESQLTAIHLAGEVNYTFTPEMEFRSSINVYAFQNQATYSAAYGLLPLELKVGFSWKPIKGLTTRVKADLWRGALSRSPGMPEKRLKDAADINLGVDYKLNKKWALWVDLNNIANIQYQRWNQYEAFGFNFIAGLRYSFTKAK
jgi:outer membrane receptor protein involved in Fe transport